MIDTGKYRVYWKMRQTASNRQTTKKSPSLSDAPNQQTRGETWKETKFCGIRLLIPAPNHPQWPCICTGLRPGTGGSMWNTIIRSTLRTSCSILFPNSPDLKRKSWCCSMAFPGKDASTRVCWAGRRYLPVANSFRTGILSWTSSKTHSFRAGVTPSARSWKTIRPALHGCKPCGRRKRTCDLRPVKQFHQKSDGRVTGKWRKVQETRYKAHDMPRRVKNEAARVECVSMSHGSPLKRIFKRARGRSRHYKQTCLQVIKWAQKIAEVLHNTS